LKKLSVFWDGADAYEFIVDDEARRHHNSVGDDLLDLGDFDELKVKMVLGFQHLQSLFEQLTFGATRAQYFYDFHIVYTL
jgi:hypothetical protein